MAEVLDGLDLSQHHAVQISTPRRKDAETQSNAGSELLTWRGSQLRTWKRRGPQWTEERA
jgi:hypothetical protein